MLAKQMLQQGLAHRRWATDKIFDAATKLDPAAYTGDSGYGHGSLHSLLFHMLRVDNVWRSVVERPNEPFAPLQPNGYPDLAAIRAAWNEEDGALAALVEGLSEEALAAPLQVTHPRYGTETTTRAFPLLHLLMHGMQHRAEAAQILTNFGQSPGDLDFIFAPGAMTPVR